MLKSILKSWLKIFATVSSALYACSASRSGLGTTTDPGSESNTFPISSTLGALKPLEKFRPMDHEGFGVYDNPALPVIEASFIFAVLKGRG